MAVQRVHVRGNMGTQILQAAAALATLDPNDEPIICINSGGNLHYDAGNHLNKVFDPKIRIIDVDEMRKTPYWREGVATSIFTNFPKIAKWLPPTDIVKMAADTAYMYGGNYAQAFHVRGGDKPIASIESYKYLLSLANGPVVYTDDSNFANEIAPIKDYTYSHNSAFDDWHAMLLSNKIFAAPSAFIMSLLLFNPEKHITFLGNKYCDGGYDISSDMIFLREAQQFCPNVEILDE